MKKLNKEEYLDKVSKSRLQAFDADYKFLEKRFVKAVEMGEVGFNIDTGFCH